MSMDLLLKPSCCKCGSSSDLYGSNCKHMTLCLNCGKTMAQNKAKCFDCGVTLTRLIREYRVRASSNNDKGYFIGRFTTGLPDFSRKKTVNNKWSLQREGLQSRRQVTDALRAKHKNKPWLLEDETGQSQYLGNLEGAQSAAYYLLMLERKEFVAIPTSSWYNFNKVAQYKQLTLEEAEEKISNRRRTAEGFGRWMMKGGRSDHKENNVGGGKTRKQNSDDDEDYFSDKGGEDVEEETARKNKLGLHKGVADDDEEGASGGDYDQDDDDDDIKKGDDWEHEENFTDDDEAVGLDPEEREDLASDVPIPPEIKQDDDVNENDEEGLSTFGKELKQLLGRASGSNESDDDDDDDDDNDEDDGDVEDEVGIPPMIASKQKDAPKKEPADNSPLKPAATGTALVNSFTSKSSMAKRKLNVETLTSNSPPPKKVKTENEPKPSVKDENMSALENNAALPKGALPSPSEVGSSTLASGSVTEEEIRAVLMQNTQLTTHDFLDKFKGRIRSSEDRKAVADIMKRISKIKKTADGSGYLVLRGG